MINEKATVAPIRRMVTGHDENGIASVLIDAPATNMKQAVPGNFATSLWATQATPADIAVGAVEDTGNRPLGIAPYANGTRFFILDVVPGNTAFMHRTDTLDYVIVMSGEIDMDMDNSTVKLKAGDVLVQRGTQHAWANRGSTPARIAFVLVDANSLGIGTPMPRPASP